MIVKKRIPSFIPSKYHHEIRCIFNEIAIDVHRKALAEIKNDDDYLRVANMDEAIKSASDGLLASLAKRPENTVSKRVLAIRSKTTRTWPIGRKERDQ